MFNQKYTSKKMPADTTDSNENKKYSKLKYTMSFLFYFYS